MDYFENQMAFYEKQLFPYMVENNIRTLMQTGDLFDNRTTINIHHFNLFTNRFCEALVEHNIKLITFLGNHDIVFKNTLEFNMVGYLEQLYPNNISVIQESSIIVVNDYKVGIIPWLLDGEKIDPILLETTDYIMGHFEINGFWHSKSAMDDKSELRADVFKNQKAVFSGHYHLNHSQGKIHYIGTPYQSNFGEFGNNCGFYHFNEDFTYEFNKNTMSNLHVKLVYDSRNTMPMRIYYSDEVFALCTLECLRERKNLEAKFIVDYAEGAEYEDYLLILKENGVKYSFINNQELEALVNPDRIQLDKTKLKSTEHFILDYIEEYNSELLDITKTILKEIEED